MQEDVEEYGDIHFDVAETMVECGYHDDAKPVLESLVASESYAKVREGYFRVANVPRFENNHKTVKKGNCNVI